MKRIRLSLTHKILFAFVAVLLPVLAVLFLIHQINKRHIESLVIADLRSIAEGKEAYLLAYLEMFKRRLEDFASDGFIRSETERLLGSGAGENGPEALNVHLEKRKLPLDESLHRLSVLSSEGRVIASSVESDIGMDFSSEGFFTEGMKGTAVTIRAAGSVGVPELAVASPVYSMDGKTKLGAIAGLMLLSEFSRGFGSGLARDLGALSWDVTAGWKTMDIYLVNSDRLMLTESPFVEDAPLRQRVDTAPVRACVEEGREVAGYYPDYRGVEVAGASMCLKDTGWTLIVEIDKSEVLSPVAAAGRLAFATVAVTVVLIGALLAFVLSVVVAQLRTLVLAAREVEAGNYAVEIPARSTDEIGLLSEAFSGMAAAVMERDAEIRRNEARLANAQKIAHVGNWEWDVESGAVLVSDEVYRILGVEKGVFIPTFDAFMGMAHPSDTACVRGSVERSLSSGAPYSAELRIVRPSGEERVVYAHGEVEYAAGGAPSRMSGTVQDITERKKAEDEVRRLNVELERRVEERTAELRAANRELEAFSYSVAHDLRAPLRIIDGFSHALVEDLGEGLGGEAREHLGRIRSSTQRMAQLIDDLLKLSYVIRAELVREPVDLSAMARAIAADIRKAYPRRDVEFIVEDSMAAVGDARLLNIVLVNLIGNAWKFTEKTRKAHIKVGSSGRRAGRTVFYVRDDGAGFDMRYGGKLFGAFQRLHSTDEFPGTGIGLATVQRIVARHGGRVWAEGETGAGATFYFTL